MSASLIFCLLSLSLLPSQDADPNTLELIFLAMAGDGGRGFDRGEIVEVERMLRRNPLPAGLVLESEP